MTLKQDGQYRLWPSHARQTLKMILVLNYLSYYYLFIVAVFFLRVLRGFHQFLPDTSQYLQTSIQSTASLQLYRINYLQNPIPENCHGILCGKYVTLNSSFAKNKTIIIITPTKKRYERIPDLTRFCQTLMHIENIHWIVIEDGIKTSDPVNRLLKRSNIPYAYFFASKQPNLSPKGWTQRNDALEYLRKYYRWFDGHAIVYFADDDNAYDIRLFDNFIRNVKNVGVWPVGLVGGAVVEGPFVEAGKVISWHAHYKPNRTFAIDMAGFGVSLNLIHSTNASFGYQCINEAPENCFLIQLGIKVNAIEPFGYKNSYMDVLVWHTNTVKSIILSKNNNGLEVEIED